MKLLSIISARSLWLFPTNDLNPRGRNIVKELLPGLIARYGFMKFPKTAEELNMQSGIKFEDGFFVNPSGEKIYVHLNAYNNGLLALTRSSTEDAESFLEDLLGWMASDFGLVSYRQLSIRRMNASEVYVECDKVLANLNPKLSEFASKLSSSVSDFVNKTFQFSGITFTGDPPAPGQKLNFIFERDAAAPFAENRYYSSAPLHTCDHLALLEELEKVLA